MAGMSFVLAAALGEFLERDEDGGGVGLIAAEEIEAGDLHGVEHAGRFARDLRDLVHDSLRAVERRGVGELRESDAVAAILRRQKAAGDDFEAERGESEQAGIDEQHDGRERVSRPTVLP
jgi:hypothetical protein